MGAFAFGRVEDSLLLIPIGDVALNESTFDAVLVEFVLYKLATCLVKITERDKGARCNKIADTSLSDAYCRSARDHVQQYPRRTICTAGQDHRLAANVLNLSGDLMVDGAII